MSVTDDRPKRLRRVAAVAVGVVVAFLLTETIFRVAGIGAPTPSKRLLRTDDDPSVEYVCYPSNPSGEFRPVPDVSNGRWLLCGFFGPPEKATAESVRETPWCVEVRRESPGIRGPKVAPRPAPGVVRIAGIGDSFALGEGVPYEKTLFVRLRDFLGPTCETLNCATSGADAGGDLLEMKSTIPVYGCSRAIVVFNLNDVDLAPQARTRMGEATDLMNLHEDRRAADSLAWPRRAFRVVDFVASSMEMRRVARETVGAYVDSYDETKNAANLAKLAETFRRMAAFPDCPAGLVIYPMMHGLDGAYPLRSCHEEAATLAHAAGLPVLDLLPAFEGQDPASLWVHPIDHHPNAKAHEIAARAVAEWLRREPRLRW